MGLPPDGTGVSDIGQDLGAAERRGRGPNAALVSVALIAAAVVLAVLALAVLDTGAALEEGGPAPDFALETFDGETIRLSDLRGKVVIINFWASWCETCDDEAAELETIWRDYKDRGLVILGIDYMDTRPAAAAYLERHAITYPNGPDKADMISRLYHLSGVPETVVVDTDGLIVPLRPSGSSAIEPSKVTGPIVPDAPFTPNDLRRLIESLTGGAGDV